VLHPPLLGSETCGSDLTHPHVECPECGCIRTPNLRKAHSAVVLVPWGCVVKQHIPLTCWTRKCSLRGALQWHNYLTRDGRHELSGEASTLKCFMISARFGATIEWLSMFHNRMLREHVSFAGEADVMTAAVERQGLTAHLPQPLRLLISDVWFKWRLTKHYASEPLGVMDLALDVEQLVRARWLHIDCHFHITAVQSARAAGMRCDVAVVDGNAKNRRAVCAAALMHVVSDAKLKKIVRTCCPCTPQLGKTCCRTHAAVGEAPQAAAADVEIVSHRVPPAALQQHDASLMLLVREVGGCEREAWVSSHQVDARSVTCYLRSVGEDRLEVSLRGRRRDIRQAAAAPGPGAPSSSSAASAVPDMTDLPLHSTAEDLAAVVCGTHKEAPALQRSLAKTAGVLCACLSSGVVVLVREIFGSESLSQRYLFLSHLVDVLPEMDVAVHDDACHVMKFALARMGDSAQAARLAPPQLRYVCDPFHMAGHTDQWCREHCDPKNDANAPLVKGIRTPVCEFTFTWLSRYRHQTKHMSEWGFKFFLLEMIASHNAVIFRGGYGAPQAAHV
jgi:hypothetical protein